MFYVVASSMHTTTEPVGLTVRDFLVYFRLHKFQADIVRRVKDLHRITYPGKNSINLEEAIAVFNKQL